MLTILPARGQRPPIPLHMGSVPAEYGRGRTVDIDVRADIANNVVQIGVYDLSAAAATDAIRRLQSALRIVSMPSSTAPEPVTAAAARRVEALTERLAELRHYLDAGDCTASQDYAAGALSMLDIVHAGLSGLTGELRRLGGSYDPN
jgi:HAMP domain-containing protein